MQWIDFEKEYPPLSGVRYLVIKKFSHGESFSEPEIDIDLGFHMNSGKFVWDKGGVVTHWMELPKVPNGVD